ncbi:MAG: hypothetical protein J6S41_01855 [Clostridia bacterium]|nr:hypothetical protein [Clostridia bacterium]
MERMHELKKRFEKELEQYMHMGDKITMGELETIHKLTDTIKNIDKIMMLEEEDGGYSQAGEMRSGMNRGGNVMPGGGYSYRRQRRDSRGRYSRDGGYSYDDGMEELHELLDEMMETADERTKAAIKRFKAELHG